MTEEASSKVENLKKIPATAKDAMSTVLDNPLETRWLKF